MSRISKKGLLTIAAGAAAVAALVTPDLRTWWLAGPLWMMAGIAAFLWLRESLSKTDAKSMGNPTFRPRTIEVPANAESRSLIDTTLPKMRPRLAPRNYGKDAKGSRIGFEVTNEGRTGYEISTPGISIGDSHVAVSGRMSSLDKHGRMFCEVDVEQNNGLMIGGLFDLMREENIDDVALSIFYRDFDQNWYVTDFKLMRNVYVSGCLEITDVSQRRAAGPPQQSPLDKGWPAQLLQG